MYVEDLKEVLRTNLTTTKKRYSHGRLRMDLQLFTQIAGFTANRPQALLYLCCRHITATRSGGGRGHATCAGGGGWHALYFVCVGVAGEHATCSESAGDTGVDDAVAGDDVVPAQCWLSPSALGPV